MVASCVFPLGATSLSNDADAAALMSSASAASEKMKYRQQAAMLDAWCALHGDNLYPCREVKERLARDMSMTYIQVNRWFANRRRKQTKRRKANAESPRSLSSVTTENSVIFGEIETSSWPKSPLTDISSIDNQRRDSEEMVIHASHSQKTLEIDAINESQRETPPSHMSNSSTFQQVPDVNRSTSSPPPPPLGGHDEQQQQRAAAHTPVDNKLSATPPAYTQSAYNSAFSNVSAAAMAMMASQAVNPLLLAAALGLHQQQQQQQQQQTAFPWVNSGAPPLSSILPYLHAHQVLMAQQAVLSQHAANMQQLNDSVVQCAPDARQWSAQSMFRDSAAQSLMPNAVLSPMLSTGDESTSELSDISEELSPPPQSCAISFRDTQQMMLIHENDDDDDEEEDGDDGGSSLIDSLLERRKDLSEMESIAIAVLAGMADCNR